MIEIIAPSELLSSNSREITTWVDTTWVDLDVDRVDFTVNNDVKVYTLSDEKTPAAQYKASVHQMIITGHITSDSELVGSGLFTKTKNLVLAGRQWYVGLTASNATTGDCGYPRVRWDDVTHNFLFQKVAIIDTAVTGNEIMNYQIGLLIMHNESD